MLHHSQISLNNISGINNTHNSGGGGGGPGDLQQMPQNQHHNTFYGGMPQQFSVAPKGGKQKASSNLNT